MLRASKIFNANQFKNSVVRTKLGSDVHFRMKLCKSLRRLRHIAKTNRHNRANFDLTAEAFTGSPHFTLQSIVIAKDATEPRKINLARRSQNERSLGAINQLNPNRFLQMLNGLARGALGQLMNGRSLRKATSLGNCAEQFESPKIQPDTY